MEALENICKRLKKNTYEYSGTNAYWVNEYLVHRHGENEKPFYASLKLKSERTVGAEDFDKKVRKSWYMGYGILPVKVQGDEYSERVLSNFDWHALPGLTEEWRTDPLPLKAVHRPHCRGRTKSQVCWPMAKPVWASIIICRRKHTVRLPPSKAITSLKTKSSPWEAASPAYAQDKGNDIVTFIGQTVLNTR